MVYSCVDLYPVGINELINKTGLSLQTVSGALVELELEVKSKRLHIIVMQECSFWLILKDSRIYCFVRD